MLRHCLLVLCFCLAASWARAADRFAFVVGVDTYPSLGSSARLERPVADARTVSAALEGVGFRVTLLTGTVTQEVMLRRFGNFADAVRPGDTALVYFAGHGIALQGTNFLLPSDIPAIEPGQEMLARSRALAETDLSAALRERGARVVVMVIDACRDNPFPKTGTRSVGQSRGLARTEPADGVFSLYAASAGQQALDRLPGVDPSPNSVFTRVFAAQLRRRDLNLIDLGESVRDEVAKLAETVPHRQVPAYYNEVRGARFVSLATPDELPRPGSGSDAQPQSPIPAAGSGPGAPQPGTAAQPGYGPGPRADDRLGDKPSSPSGPLPTARPHEPRVAAVPDRLPPQPSLQVPAMQSFSYPVGLDPTGDNWVALRSLPTGSAGSRLAKLGPNALFTVTGRQGAWVAVRLRSGQTGWVHGDYVGCCRRAPSNP